MTLMKFHKSIRHETEKYRKQDLEEIEENISLWQQVNAGFTKKKDDSIDLQFYSVVKVFHNFCELQKFLLVVDILRPSCGCYTRRLES